MGLRLTPQERRKLEKMTEKLRRHEKVNEMKKYIQHGNISTFDHCVRVTELSYLLNKRLRLKANEKNLIMGAFLHDFYLYDWHHEDNGEHDLHGFFHPGTAKKNARKYFNVTDDVAHIIESHMWPLTITKLPKTREAWIVTLADKYISTKETLLERSSKGKN